MNTNNYNKHFKDTKGNIPKVGDIIADENGTLGKVISFYKTDYKYTTNGYRMIVDFNSHTVEFNPENKFTIQSSKTLTNFEQVKNWLNEPI